MPEIYGLKNCDSCRKARKWLDAHGLRVTFVDIRENPPTARNLIRWVQDLGWQTLLNRHSRSWRELPEAARTDLDAEKASALMHANPLLIKRPVLVRKHQVHVGFSADHYAEIFGVN